MTIWNDNGADKMLFRSVLEDMAIAVTKWSPDQNLSTWLSPCIYERGVYFNPLHSPIFLPSLPCWPFCPPLPLTSCILPPLADLRETASPLSRRKKIIKVRWRCRQADQKSRDAGEETGWLGALKHFVVEKVNGMLQALEFWSRD